MALASVRPPYLVSYQAVQQGYITIKALGQRSGVHKQTIHYYLRKGLLPPPVRTSKTSALYPPSTVDLLKLIKDYQDERRLTLEEIAELFRRHDYDPLLLERALSAEVSGRIPLPSEATGQWLTLEELSAALDPAPEPRWIQELVVSGLLQPEPVNGRLQFPPSSLKLAKTVWEGVRMGVSLPQFTTMAGLVSQQAERELTEFLRFLHDIPLPNDGYPQVAKLFDVFERFGAVWRHRALHTRFIQGAYERSRYLFVGPNRKYVFPSETFLERMGLNREIDRLLLRADKFPNDLATQKNLARAYNLRSDWVRLAEVSYKILRHYPNDVTSLANYGQALMYLGRNDESVAVLDAAVKRTNHPLIKLRLGQSIVNRARQSGDAVELFDAIVRQARLASQAIRESQEVPSLSRKIRLILALDHMGLSDPLGLEGPSVEELLRLYNEFRNLPERDLPLLGRISLAMSRMFATYALYLLRQKNGHPDAEKLRREIAAADPDGVLTARSSRRPAAKEKTSTARASTVRSGRGKRRR